MYHIRDEGNTSFVYITFKFTECFEICQDEMRCIKVWYRYLDLKKIFVNHSFLFRNNPNMLNWTQLIWKHAGNTVTLPFIFVYLLSHGINQDCKLLVLYVCTASSTKVANLWLGPLSITVIFKMCYKIISLILLILLLKSSLCF